MPLTLRSHGFARREEKLSVTATTGIAGLACALALRRVGHNVIVLERGDRSSSVSGLIVHAGGDLTSGTLRC